VKSIVLVLVVVLVLDSSHCSFTGRQDVGIEELDEIAA